MDNNNTTQVTETKENNKKLVIIASIAIAVLVAVFVVLGISFNWFGGKKASDKKASNNAPTISVVKVKGNEADSKKIKINIRDIKFGTPIKKIKKYEDKQKDTVANPSEASTKDGYTYLTYLFDPKKAEFFGVKPGESQSGALLQYVFKKKKVFDIRIQFGDISDKDVKKLRKALIKKYGKPTYSIKYSNNATRDSWRTSAKKYDQQTMLSLNDSPNSGASISYESFKR